MKTHDQLQKLRELLARTRGKATPAWTALEKFFTAKSTRKIMKIGGLAIMGVVLFAGLAFFTFRNTALRRVLDSKIRSFQQRSPGTVVEIGTARFKGMSRIDLENIRLLTGNKTFALDLDSCSVKFSFWSMLVGKVRLKHLELSDLKLDLRQSADPLPAATPARAKNKAAPLKPEPDPRQLPDYATRAVRLLDLYFNRIPDSLVIDRLTIHTAFDDIPQALYIPRLAIQGPAFATTVEIFDQGKKWACLLSGAIERGKKQLELRLQPQRDNGPDGLRKGGPALLPFIERQWGLKVSFDSAKIDLASRGLRRGVLQLDGSLAIAGLALNHPRIAAEDVNLPGAGLDYVLNIGCDYFELNNSTLAHFDKLHFHPYLKLKTRPSQQLTIKLERTRFLADDLFSSLPDGLFTHLAGIRTSGELAYHLDFAIDLAHPEAIELDSELERIDFKIEHFGRVDFRAVNAPFQYTAYEKDRAVRSFRVGPENPSFCPYAQIPDYLKNAVMISEDGAFFSHHGFLLEPFKNSIVTNLKAGRFVRGASTISMQLVKNLYLRRNKTMARKLEEMLITWLIEEKRLIPKERMFEIYLNIIEWGPGVYGAAEGARYYFDKEVADLTLAEAVFMAAVVPRPKRFFYFFDENQHLRPWLGHYYADVSRKMLARGWISQEDFDTLLPDVQLKGPARLLLKGVEAPAEEPLDEEEPDWP